MFVGLKKYLIAVERHAAELARCGVYKAQMLKREAEAISARREVRRLTDVIIHLKEQGKVLEPGHGDEVWGKYVMGEEDAEEPRTHAVYAEPTSSEREAAVGEAEFHQELLAALEAEEGH